MAWDPTAANTLLRQCLGDGPKNHFEFKADVSPTPDGTHRSFFVGRTNVIEDGFTAVLAGVTLASDAWSLDAVNGVITLTGAPAVPLQCSFNYQWFTDVELTGFLLDASTQLGFSGADDSGLPTALRSVTLDLAMAHAFTSKAAEFADGVQASSPDGYSIDQQKSAPNWAKLATDALTRANSKFKWYIDSPLAGGKPAMAMTSFKLPLFTPLVR